MQASACSIFIQQLGPTRVPSDRSLLELIYRFKTEALLFVVEEEPDAAASLPPLVEAATSRTLNR